MGRFFVTARKYKLLQIVCNSLGKQVDADSFELGEIRGQLREVSSRHEEMKQEIRRLQKIVDQFWLIAEICEEVAHQDLITKAT